MADLLGKKVRAQSLVDAVAERLEEAILSGVVEPGRRLSELALAKSFGVSRAPLREAIRRLEGRKLLQRTPNIGVRVVARSSQDMSEVLQMHGALQSLACALAAKNMTVEEIAALQAMLDQHDCRSVSNEAGESDYDFDLDWDFHLRIIMASRNRHLIETVVEDLSRLWGKSYVSGARASRWSACWQEHKVIIAALANRDAVAAERAMRQHIENDRLNLPAVLEPVPSNEGDYRRSETQAAVEGARHRSGYMTLSRWMSHRNIG